MPRLEEYNVGAEEQRWWFDFVVFFGRIFCFNITFGLLFCFENENAMTEECGMGIEDKTRGGMVQLSLSGQPLLYTLKISMFHRLL